VKTAADLYPSRANSPPALVPRLDPVVYGDTGGGGALDRYALRKYERKGFLFLEGFFSREEVGLFGAAIDRLCASAAIKGSPAAVLEPESCQLRSLFDVHRASPVFGELARDRRLVLIAEQLLGSQVYVHQSRANLKPGFAGREFYWHSDFETWHVEDGMPRMRALSCSISLTENTPFNGPLMVIPGSHRHFVSCAGTTPEDHYLVSLKKQELGVPDQEHIRRLAEEGGMAAPTGRAGSVLLFDCNILHGSNSNISPWPRSNLFLVYNSVENPLGPPFCGRQPRPEFIASRNFTPIAPAEPRYKLPAA
jgi:ectoine hydroxylase